MGGKDKVGGEKMYFCSFDGCGMKFNRPSRLQWHITQHTGEKPHKCDIGDCDKAYASTTKLKRHQNTFHKISTDVERAELDEGEEKERPDVTPAPSAYPTPESSVASELHRCDSMNSLGSMIGSPGAYSFTTSCTGSEVDGSEFKYKCKVEGCERRFKTKMNLYNHRVVQHEKRDRFKCEVVGCDKAFAFPTLLKAHMKTHTGYNCEQCGEKFQKWTDVRKHIATSHKKVHACSQCNKTFQRPCDLHRHQLTHSGTKVKYTCPEDGCTKSYDRVATLRKHITHQHHGELPYKCELEQCVAAFPHLHDLQRHMKYHNNDKNEKKTYPAKGHRKIPLVGRLVGPIPATVTVSSSSDQQLESNLTSPPSQPELCSSDSTNQSQLHSSDITGQSQHLYSDVADQSHQLYSDTINQSHQPSTGMADQSQLTLVDPQLYGESTTPQLEIQDLTSSEGETIICPSQKRAGERIAHGLQANFRASPETEPDLRRPKRTLPPSLHSLEEVAEKSLRSDFADSGYHDETVVPLPPDNATCHDYQYSLMDL